MFKQNMPSQERDHLSLAKQGVKRLPILLLLKLFVIAVCLALFATDLLRTFDARETRLREASADTLNLARSLAQHAEDTIKEADTVLVGLVERVEFDGTGKSSLKRLRRIMTARVNELPKLHGLFLYDEHGHWLVNSQPGHLRKENNSDRAYFIYHRTHTDSAPFIGKPIQSRSTGEWILTVSRRIARRDGSFAGVALATIHAKYFSDFYHTFDIGKSGAIFLMHANGTLLMRRPFSDQVLGTNLASFPIFNIKISKPDSGTYEGTHAGIDTENRIISYQRVKQYPLTVTASLTVDEVLQPWRTGAYKHLGATAILALVIGILGGILLRQISRRLRIESELSIAQSELKSLNIELEKMAMQDGLTGLANRRMFDLTLNEEFNRVERHSGSLGLIMIDVDMFKKFNDVFGHPAGDECLRKIAATINSCQSRSGDLAARYGGEEFAVLLPDTDIDGTETVAERIRIAIRDLAIPHPNHPLGIVTVSCGVDAIKPTRTKNLPMDLLQTADAALLTAKTDGRDRIVRSRPSN